MFLHGFCYGYELSLIHISILETHFPIDDLYLYQPNLANYYYDKNWCERFKVIPKIDGKDQKFRKIIKDVYKRQVTGKAVVIPVGSTTYVQTMEDTTIQGMVYQGK